MSEPTKTRDAATMPAFSVGQLVGVSYMGETYEGVICEIVKGDGRQRRRFYKVDLGPQLGKPAYEEHEIGMPQ